MMHPIVKVMMFILFFATACSTDNVRTLGEGEKDLDTWEDTPIWFHSALYYPSEISLNFPGYIIGIEKSPKELIAQDGDVITVNIPEAGEEMAQHISRIGDDDKLLFISHILENFGDQHGLRACAHYNAYYRERNSQTHIPFCQPDEVRQVNPQRAYWSSWEALDVLKRDIHRKLQSQPYTHIVIGMMGWNTDQEEAVRNFNSVAKNVWLAAMEAGADDFKPLFIGITWPSKWAADWITPIITLFSYGNKADDADEVGFGWLGVLLHDTLRHLPADVPVVVLGHSFGARVSSMGVCMGPAVVRKKGDALLPRNKISLLISLQGAYSMNRYYADQGREGIYYPGGCENAEHVVLTSSKYDTAMDNKSFVPFVGNDTTYDEHCKERPETEFDCIKASKDGDLTLSPVNQKQKTYINADELIYFNAYGSGGLAHSDIYRKEMGVMLWKVISAKAPSRR
ncbi:MAG: alpha/beta hydrolase [Nitrospirales bacterium]|nr:hypothetical protein [Nitrospira sp.]MDR4500685.1 alpha/beta hydrolase [Nitrospirales bacterium]